MISHKITFRPLVLATLLTWAAYIFTLLTTSFDLAQELQRINIFIINYNSASSSKHLSQLTIPDNLTKDEAKELTARRESAAKEASGKIEKLTEEFNNIKTLKLVELSSRKPISDALKFEWTKESLKIPHTSEIKTRNFAQSDEYRIHASPKLITITVALTILSLISISTTLEFTKLITPSIAHWKKHILGLILSATAILTAITINLPLHVAQNNLPFELLPWGAMQNKDLLTPAIYTINTMLIYTGYKLIDAYHKALTTETAPEKQIKKPYKPIKVRK